jgi:hypothetical protein
VKTASGISEGRCGVSRIWGQVLRMGGVNRCPSRCRLAKIRGLIDVIVTGGKYSAVIGRKTRFLYVPSRNVQAMGSFQSQSQR